MKIRKGFVSNSSSSSYICDVCRETCGGFDLNLEDAEMIECVNSHTVCDEHIENLQEHFDRFEEKQEVLRQAAEKEGEKWHTWASDKRYDVPSYYCPLCNLEALSESEELEYYRMRFGMDSHDVLEDIVETFKDYGSFRQAISDARRQMFERKHDLGDDDGLDTTLKLNNAITTFEAEQEGEE